jgi:hypothetical protein
MFLLFQVLEESRHDEEMEEEPNGDHEERGLDEEPPEALPSGMQQRDPVRLDKSPDDAGKRSRRPDRGHDPRPRRSSL